MSVQTSAPQNAITFATHYDMGGCANLEDRVAARRIHTASGPSLTVAMVLDGIGGYTSGSERFSPWNHLILIAPALGTVGVVDELWHRLYKLGFLH